MPAGFQPPLDTIGDILRVVPPNFRASLVLVYHTHTFDLQLLRMVGRRGEHVMGCISLLSSRVVINDCLRHGL